MRTLNDIRNEFPQLSSTVYGKPLVYLDNAATSLRPVTVMDKWREMAYEKNSNLHRAVHRTAETATAEYEDARDFVRTYLGAASREEIIFTSGATESINLVAYSFSEAFIEPGDEVVVAECEHHSDLVPWQLACRRKSAVLKVLPVDDSGHLRLELLPELVTERTKILCVAHISNVLGLVNPVKEIVKYCHSVGCKVLCDGAQGIVHCPVNVSDLDCDFYVFSGHKIYSATGVGVLYGKKELLEQMPPFLSGGEMIGTVSWSGSTFAPLPQKFEAGTRNFLAYPTLVPALKLAGEMSDGPVAENMRKVCGFVLDSLLGDDRITLYGVPRGTMEKAPVFSITVKGAHHEDLALIMDKMGIALRSGQMCAEPLMNRFSQSGMLRASFAPYNTMEEAEYFIRSLNKAIEMLV